MKNISDLTIYDDVNLIENEINERIDMIHNMVGWLYPSILLCEIEKLDILRRTIMLNSEKGN